jgi:hypothetical protein
LACEKKKVRSYYDLGNASDVVLEEWANDPNTANPQVCRNTLEERRNVLLREEERLLKKRQILQEDPFDPRTEVSADARKIVRNLWIIFVLMPFVIAVLYAILSSIK